jgi:hypothetical protein
VAQPTPSRTLRLLHAAAAVVDELEVGLAQLAADRVAERLAPDGARASTPCRRAGPRPPGAARRRRSARRSRGRGGARRRRRSRWSSSARARPSRRRASCPSRAASAMSAIARALTRSPSRSSRTPLATPRISRRPLGRTVALVTSQKTSKSASTSKVQSASSRPASERATIGLELRRGRRACAGRAPRRRSRWSCRAPRGPGPGSAERAAAGLLGAARRVSAARAAGPVPDDLDCRPGRRSRCCRRSWDVESVLGSSPCLEHVQLERVSSLILRTRL